MLFVLGVEYVVRVKFADRGRKVNGEPGFGRLG
jgi:hypothetical protein